jgi:AraC-like DNA-binding protein
MRREALARQIGPAVAGGPDELVSIRMLKFFDEIVEECGGAPDDLLRRAGIDPAQLYERDARIPYQLYCDALTEAAEALGCPDIGMRLARRQAPNGVGPTSVAMHNSATLGAAFRYLCDHLYTYGTIVRLSSVESPADNEWRVDFEVMCGLTTDPRQAIEHAIIGAQLGALCMSSGRAAVREIWFRHDPISPPETYKAYASAPVRFAQAWNRVVLDPASAELPVVGRDDEVYELATRFIDMRYARPHEPLHARVRRVLSQMAALGEVQTSDVAAALCMHPRTFQRKLREEGLRFDAIRDEMRRELAHRYLRHTQLPLSQVANMLGYHELSAFSRSCQRWFGAAPGHLRRSREPAES